MFLSNTVEGGPARSPAFRGTPPGRTVERTHRKHAHTSTFHQVSDGWRVGRRALSQVSIGDLAGPSVLVYGRPMAAHGPSDDRRSLTTDVQWIPF